MKNAKCDPIHKGFIVRKRRYYAMISLIIFFILVFSVLIMTYGRTTYSLKTVINVLAGQNISGATFTIKKLRLPRLIGALLCGCAFAISGNTFQKLLGNPLASPDVIGVTAGASVSAVFCILILNLSGIIVPIIAVITALIVSFIIYALSNISGYSNSKLILIGIAVQALLNAVLSFIILRANEHDVPKALRWLSGSLNGIQLDKLPSLAVVVILSTVILLLMRKHLLIIQLQREQALAIGLPVAKTRIILIIVSILAASFATSVSGPIASIAFLSGPIASKLAGKGNSNVLSSALIGALLVLIADFVGQYAFLYKYPVGIITGILGAPYLLILLFKLNQR